MNNTKYSMASLIGLTDAEKRERLDAAVTDMETRRGNQRLTDDLRKAKADAWDEAMNAALQQVPYTSQAKRGPYESGFVEGVKVCDDAIRKLTNPYGSKTDET